MSIVLTEPAIRAALRQAETARVRIELADELMPGVRLRVNAAGKGTWVLACRDRANSMRRFPLGAWPSLGIAEARKRAQVLRVDVRRGADPISERRAAAAAKREKALSDQFTFEKLVDEWSRRHLAKRSDRYRVEAGRALKNAFAGVWGRPAAGLDSASVRQALAAIERRRPRQGMVGDRSAIQARTVAYGRACFGWALKHALVPHNPFQAVPLPDTGTARDRVLDDGELAEILKAAGAESTFGRIIRLLATTGQRANEVAEMRWEEVSADGTLWTLPGSRTKNARAHTVPLSAAARLALHGLVRPDNGRDLVFPSSTNRPFAGWSNAKVALDRAIGRARGKDAEAMPTWRIHDLRRTAATGLEKLGVPLAVTEIILNHRSGSRSGIVGVYQRHDYAAERRQALDAWSAYVSGLLAEGVGVAQAGSNVVELRRAR